MIDFVTELYKITAIFPKEKLYGLTNQMRRAAVSITSNIAEGIVIKSNKEFIQFLYIAFGEYCGNKIQLIISKNLMLLDEVSFIELDKERNELRQMLLGSIFCLLVHHKNSNE